MRPGQQNKRSRGRSSGGGSSNNNNNNNNYNRKGSNPLTRSYDSSGPDVKIRGTAQHVAEKYSQLARDAHSSGDRVMAENYLQHAEHYNRIIAAAQAQMQERVQRDDRGEPQDRDTMDRDGDDFDQMDDRGYNPQPVEIAGSGPQPVIPEVPVEVVAASEAPVDGAERGPSRRRAASNRPRRTRRGSGSDEQAEAGEASSGDAGTEGGEQPVLVTASE
ncbi:DUF4167 domain-containing protein [Agrobacterium sp. a22-2]|uniref:DUF4167 domain-containing protein n=1 Tax=Agrobacterium sp. a22-2 TaxID=2283840 RepID=UPI001447FF1B|nr:DUF4167 domain-containing protein [Agrobacterium sp. a22-2]NKN37103.1 DUF4167 domain-containing protein [Agrobacterium sp. a22-2]